ncbi:MAG: helix-turn-helix transcriptional regulator [Paludibacter sp.]|nr:helix-turn-helix transcriptional regulator [Paludibacter sp.]
MEKFLTKIRDVRKERGLSLENMADELQISHTAYRKIETNQCKLSVERLVQIAAILKTSASELLDEKASHVYHQTNNDNATFIGHQEFENYYQENKELTQNFMESLQNEIAHLKTEIEFLRSIVKK